MPRALATMGLGACRNPGSRTHRFPPCRRPQQTSQRPGLPPGAMPVLRLESLSAERKKLGAFFFFYSLSRRPTSEIPPPSPWKLGVRSRGRQGRGSAPQLLPESLQRLPGGEPPRAPRPSPLLFPAALPSRPRPFSPNRIPGALFAGSSAAGAHGARSPPPPRGRADWPLRAVPSGAGGLRRKVLCVRGKLDLRRLGGSSFPRLRGSVRGHGGAPFAAGGGGGGGGRGRARGGPGQEPLPADGRGRVRHLLRGGPRAHGAGQRPPGDTAAVQDRPRAGDAGGAGGRGQPGGRGAADGAGQPAEGGGGAAQRGRGGRPRGEPGTRQDGGGPVRPQPAALHAAGAAGRAAGAQQAQGAAAADAGGAAVLPEGPDSSTRRPRGEEREGLRGCQGRQRQQKQGGEDHHEEAVLLPVWEAAIDVRRRFSDPRRQPTRKTSQSAQGHRTHCPRSRVSPRRRPRGEEVRFSPGHCLPGAELDTPEGVARAGQVAPRNQESRRKRKRKKKEKKKTQQGKQNKTKNESRSKVQGPPPARASRRGSQAPPLRSHT